MSFITDCQACGNLGYSGYKSPRHYPIEEVNFCDCARGQALHTKALADQTPQAPPAITNSVTPERYKGFVLADIEKMGQGHDEKRAACAAALLMAQDEQIDSKVGLLLSGDYGTGKTTILSALINYHVSAGKSAIWTTARTLFRNVQDAINDHTSHKVLQAYIDADYLLIDDLGDTETQRLEETDHKRGILLDIIDERNNWLRPTYISTNLKPAALAAIFGSKTVERILHLCHREVIGGDNLRRLK